MAGAGVDGVLDLAVDEGAEPFVGVPAAGAAAFDPAAPLAGVAVVGAVEAGATVADSTFEVMFGDPAELGVDALEGAVEEETLAAVVFEAVPGGEGTAEALWAAPLALVPVAACAAGLGVFVGVGALVATAIPGPAVVLAGATDPDFVVTAIVEAAGGVRTEAGCELCTVTVLAAAGPAFCAAGTLPAPGVPFPGNTVPSCKLPSFGCVAGGVEMGEEAAACALAAGCLSGKLIGGNLGGVGIGACAVVVSGTTVASGLRWKTPISGAEAAGAGLFRRAAVSGPCTRNVIVLPSALSV